MPIYYTGIGSKSSGIHNEAEFHLIMIREFIRRNWSLPSNQNRLLLVIDYGRSVNRNLPDEFPLFSLDDWIEFSGADRI